MSADIIDTNVVQLRFDNREFVNNVNHSVEAVESLKDSLNFDSTSFDSLTKAANNIDLSAVAANIESLSDRFSTFGIVGMTAIQKITEEVMNLGGKLVGLLAKPWKQIVTGGWSRASNIGQATFQLEGLFGKTEEGVAKLNMTMKATSDQVIALSKQSGDLIVAMNAADYAVADTAYGLDSAAKAASVLATSGVDVLHFSEDLKDANGLMRTEMQVALRAISGVASMANRSYDDVARVFERVSGAGRVMGDDLNSLASYGLNAAATLRDYLNDLGVTVNATEQDIRDMVSHGEIDFMTFAKAMDNAYGDHAKDANNTFSGAFSNMKFALSKIGADFISPIRTKMVPLFNDVRIAINNVRKALNFKMKFPWVEEEISIVELFTNVITNLTSKAHDLFTAWNGGQTIMEKAMAGLAEFTGVSMVEIKNVYDGVEKGTIKSADAIRRLISITSNSGKDMREVFKTLSESLGETEDDIYRMCYNGEISFEDFSNAVSSTFGNLVQETRISQLAQLFNNVIQAVVNLASTVTSIVGPAIWAFFQVFTGGGIKSVIDVTSAFPEFTKRLILSRQNQEKVRRVAFRLFMVLKSGLKIVARLASSAFKIVESMAPLIGHVLDFVDVLSEVIEYLVNIVVESNLLSSTISVLCNVIKLAGYIIVNVLKTLMVLIEPVIRGISEIFAFLARSIGSVDVSFLDVIIERFRDLLATVANGGLAYVLQNLIGTIFYTIASVFRAMTLTFSWFNTMLQNAANTVANIIDRITTIFRNFRDVVINLFNGIKDFFNNDFNLETAIAMFGRLVGLSAMIRLATGIRGIGRALDGFANIVNSNALVNVTAAIKTVARAVLEFSIAMVLVSSIPRENLSTAIALFSTLVAAIIAFMVVFYGYQLILNHMNNKIISDPYVKFMNKLSASINAMMANVGRAAVIMSFGFLLMSIALALGFMIKGIVQLNELPMNTFTDGYYRLVAIFSLLAGFFAIIAFAQRSIVQASGAQFITNNNISTHNGMMGVAVTLMALLVVVKAFETIIVEYSQIDPDQFTAGFAYIASTLMIMASMIAVIGLAVKNAGFGMVGASIAMLSFLVVLHGFIDIIRDYTKLIKNFRSVDQLKLALGTVLTILVFLTVAISAIGLALTYFGGGSAFSASIKNGLSFTNNAPKFLGVVMTIVSLAVALQSVSLLIMAINYAGIEKAWAAIGIIFVILGGVFASMMAIRGVKAGSIAGVAAILLELALVLPVLMNYDPMKVLSSATGMLLVIYAISFMLKAMGEAEIGIAKGIGFSILLFTLLLMLSSAFIILTNIDSASVLSSGLAIAATLAAFGVALKFASGFKFKPGIFRTIVAMLGAIIPFLLLLTAVKDFDPVKFSVLGTVLSVLAVSIGGAIRLMKGVISAGAQTIFASFIGIAIALSVLMAALVLSANGITTDISTIAGFAAALMLLLPTIAAMAAISIALSRFKATFASVGVLAIIAGILAGLITVFSVIARFSDVNATVSLIEGLQWGLLRLSAFMTVLAGFAIALGFLFMTPLGIADFALGLLAVGSMLATISVFIGMIAASATLGDANSTVYLLENLGTILDSMVPFLLKMAGMCALFGLVSPLVLGGAIGMGAILTVIAGFAGMIAAIALIGNPEETVDLLRGLIFAMDNFNDFLGHFMLVLTLLGSVAPVAFLGAMVLNTIFAILTNFTASIAVIGTVGNTSDTLTVMTMLVDSLRELVNVFMIVMVLGAMGAAVLTGMILISESMSLLLGLSFMIGQIGSIRKPIITGINTILFTAVAMLEATRAMGDIELGSILNFIFAMSLIALTPINGVAKFSQIGTMLLMMGMSSVYILKGTQTAISMIEGLRRASYLIRDIVRIDSKKLVNLSRDILSTSTTINAIYASIGGWVGHSIAEGVLSGGSLGAVVEAGVILAHALEESIRDTAHIHSYSPLYGEIGGWSSRSMGIGVLSESGFLMNSGSDMMGNFGSLMGNLSTVYGTDSGAQYVESFSETLFSGLQYVVQGWGDLFTYAGQSGALGGFGHMIFDDKEIKALTNSNNNYAASVNAVNNANTRLINQNGTRPYFSPNLVKEVSEDEYIDYLMNEAMPDFGDLSSWFEGLKESFNLGSITEGLEDFGGAIEDVGDVSGSASSKISDLQRKIDNLMEDYENRMETAKERASKDLFKNVDEQGEDFLEKIQDIMKQYNNIYKSAVEETNNQDLFAEVKENDESFAPETLLKNLENQVDQVNELNTIVLSLSQRVGDENLRQAISNMDVDQLPQLRALYRMSSSELANYEKLYQEKVAANQEKIQNKLSGEISQITGKYTNIASFVATDVSTQLLEHNLQTQIDKLNEYNETVSSLMVRIKDVNLREAISNMGVESVEELKILNAMTDEQLDNYVSLYNVKMQGELKNVTNELSGQLGSLLGEAVDIEEFYQAYKLKMGDLSEMVSSDDSGTKNVGRSAGRTIGTGMSEGISETYSSENAYQTGKDYTMSVAKGMSDPEVITFLETTADGIINMIIEPLQEAHEDYKAGGIEVVTALLSGINEAKDEGFDEVIDGITARILETFAECDDDYRESGHALINAFCQGIEEGMSYEQGFEGTIDSIINTIIATFEESYEMDFPQIGHNVLHYVSEGIEEAKDQGFEETIDDIVNIIIQTLSIEDTYEDYFECGHTIVHKLCEGIDDAKDWSFTSCIEDIVTRIKTAITNKNDVIVAVGEFISFGLARGMNSERALHSVETSAAAVASKAIGKAKEVLDSHSPSRVFIEIGRFIDEGLAIGLRQYSGLAEDASTDVAETSISAVQEAINQLSGMLDGSIDVNPVITPTLDLSEVNARSQALAGMFSNRQIAVQARADEQQTEMMNQLGNILAEQNSEPRSITFNQTNNSPKALSRTEIYRQTRNGFSQLVNAIS
jgi:hypothetical protein